MGVRTGSMRRSLVVAFLLGLGVLGLAALAQFFWPNSRVDNIFSDGTRTILPAAPSP